jgi:hypothetical protein
MGRVFLTIVLCAAVLVTGFPGSAHADGDPASDYLVASDVFTGVETPPPSAKALTLAVSKAFGAGYRVKVAVVPRAVDLGAIPSLFNKPAAYAKFLGLELRLMYAGPLLIVMPKGFGIYDAGRATRAEAKVLAALETRGARSAETLTRLAVEAVRALTRSGALRSKDILAPAAYPQFTAVKAGTTATLTYRIQEDSERSRDTVTVFSGDTALATFARPLGRTVFATAYSVTWNVPQPLPENLRWCVVPTDAAGNTGKPACLPMRVAGP